LRGDADFRYRLSALLDVPMKEPAGKLPDDPLTLEEFIGLAARESIGARVGRSLARVAAPLVPVPSVRAKLRRIVEHHHSALEGVRKMRCIYGAMTPVERANPLIIDHARRGEIARVAGVEPMEVSQLVRSFDAAKRAQARVNEERESRA
jgi:hypothetical protein